MRHRDAMILYHDYLLLGSILSVLKSISPSKNWTEFVKRYVNPLAKLCGVRFYKDYSGFISVRVRKDVKERLQECATRKGVSVSELVRNAVEKLVADIWRCVDRLASTRGDNLTGSTILTFWAGDELYAWLKVAEAALNIDKSTIVKHAINQLLETECRA